VHPLLGVVQYEATQRRSGQLGAMPCSTFAPPLPVNAGLRSVDPRPLAEEYQSAYLEMYHRVFDLIDAVVGEQVWNFADFATTSGVARVGGNKKGVFTRERNPKSAAFVLHRRWRALA
jgi:beta-galactosidase/beta-glucuronidase